jgi:predicted O-methyltransferase YrrM
MPILFILASLLFCDGYALESESACPQPDPVSMLQSSISKHSDLARALPKPAVEIKLLSNSPSAIPKHIFTFWDSRPMPKLIKLCIDAIRRLNPDWEVHVLSLANLTNVPQPHPIGFEKLKIQHQTDWLRLVLLKYYGGVWLDASVIPLQPVSSWVDLNSNAVQGFATPWFERDCRCQILENWAVAAPTGNSLLEAWLLEYERAITLGFTEYQKELKSLGQAQGKTYKVINDNLPYLSQHAAFMRVHMTRRRDPLIVHSSDQGPLWFVSASNYSAATAAQMLTTFDKSHCAFSKVPFLKLPGNERDEVSRLLEGQNYTGNSAVHTALGLPSSNAAQAQPTVSEMLPGMGTFVVNTGTRNCVDTTLKTASALGLHTTELGGAGSNDLEATALQNNVSLAAIRFAKTMPGHVQQLLAHATAWKKLVDSNLSEVLVLEAGVSLSSISQADFCSIVYRRPVGNLFQLATKPAVDDQHVEQPASTCCTSSDDGDCSSWMPGGEYGSAAYMLSRLAAVELYGRLEHGNLLWPTTAPVSYALRTTQHAYHLRMPLPVQSYPAKDAASSSSFLQQCGTVGEAEGCNSAVHPDADTSDHVLATTCAQRIVNHSAAVRDAGFPIPVNGAHTEAVEGGTSYHEATYLGELARRASFKSKWNTLCQTGFNYGTSAQAMLCAADPSVKLYSWDLGEHPYVKSANHLIQAQYQGRHFLTLGDSTKTLKDAVSAGGPLPDGARCDFVFVDGGHTLEVATADIVNFKSLATPGAMLVVDDCGDVSRPGADQSVSMAFMNAVTAGLVVPDGETALHLQTHFGSQAHAICVGRYAA